MMLASVVTDTLTTASTLCERVSVRAVAVGTEKASTLSPPGTPKTLVHNHEFRLCGLKQRADTRNVPDIARCRVLNNKRDLVLLESAQQGKESSDLKVALSETFQIFL